MNNLQQSSEIHKSIGNAKVVSEFNEKETKVQQHIQQKNEQFKNILKCVANIEKEIEHQQN